MNRTFKNIMALLASIAPTAPSIAEDQHLTIIGNWQIEDVRTFSGSIRQSGKEGQVGYFLTPLSVDANKNGLFYITCLGKNLYLDIELQQRIRDIASIQLQEFSVEIEKTGHTLHFEMNNAIIEHDLLKIPVSDIDIRALGEGLKFDLVVRYQQVLQKTQFRMNKSQEAITDFLRQCSSYR